MTITIKGAEYNTDLIELNLSGCELADADIVPLRQMKNLQVLNLQNNEISDISPLRELTELQNLNLHMNPIHDISPLFGLTNLQRLTLIEDSKETAEQINQLRETLPNCTIVNFLDLGGIFMTVEALKQIAADIKKDKKEEAP